MSKLRSGNAKRASNTVVFMLKNTRGKVVMLGTTKQPQSLGNVHADKVFEKIVVCSRRLSPMLASKRCSKLMHRYLKTHEQKPFYNR